MLPFGAFDAVPNTEMRYVWPLFGTDIAGTHGLE